MTLTRLVASAALLAALTIPCSAASVPFALTVVDFGAPTTFIFSFAGPYVGGPYTTSSLEFSLTLTDGGRDGATATGSLDGYVDSVLASTLPFTCAVPFTGAEGGTQTCTGSISELFAAPATGDLEARFTFALSGGDDKVEASGIHELTNPDGEVPEPSALALAASGLALLGLLRARRR
jgi:hypothetical protein